jgi:hypothetical protein
VVFQQRVGLGSEFGLEKLKGRYHLGDIGIDENINRLFGKMCA